MIVKVIGILLALVGFLMLKFFPDILDYQPEGFSKSGIMIAIVLVLLGIAMIILG
jgi:hypothetical protein